jgi:hypothetical protein
MLSVQRQRCLITVSLVWLLNAVLAGKRVPRHDIIFGTVSLRALPLLLLLLLRLRLFGILGQSWAGQHMGKQAQLWAGPGLFGRKGFSGGDLLGKGLFGVKTVGLSLFKPGLNLGLPRRRGRLHILFGHLRQ